MISDDGQRAYRSVLQIETRYTAQAYPAAVLNIPMKNAKAAERKLRSLVYAAPYQKAAPVPPAFSPKYALYPEARRFAQYLLPRNTMLARFTGISGSSYYTFACFYRGDLLLAPDAASISAYIARVREPKNLSFSPISPRRQNLRKVTVYAYVAAAGNLIKHEIPVCIAEPDKTRHCSLYSPPGR